VVLHGCTQNAAVYDQGSGWSRLADRLGFILLFPEQQRANNPMLCFNWFTAEDSTRGLGEVASIRAMIDAIGEQHAIDRQRIFVTGLSAGGAMASAMLANHPELFAAGAIIAGLPFGCASSVSEAFDCMGGRGSAQAAALGGKVRDASSHPGPWPRVQVWQGSADRRWCPAMPTRSSAMGAGPWSARAAEPNGDGRGAQPADLGVGRRHGPGRAI
jgi:poly(hydroxyalkanoate) depolymerase family esterase